MVFNRVPVTLRWLGLSVVAFLVAKLAAMTFWPHTLDRGSLERVASLLGDRRTVAGILARPAEAPAVVEVDAFCSAAGGLPLAPGQAPCAGDNWAVLSDTPFLVQLSLLGIDEPNALLTDAPWLLIAVPSGESQSPLPYHARFRGRLKEAPAGCPKGVRVLELERVVRVYAARPPGSQALGGYSAWSRYQDAQAGYSVPCPPGWRAEPVDANQVALTSSDWPDGPITIRVHGGETHRDPYLPDELPPLLQGVSWSAFSQSALGMEDSGQGLYGYRIAREGGVSERTASVLFSGHGKTYELGIRYPLGFAASQSLLSAYTAVVAGFRFDALPAPSPTPPVRQALGPGPFYTEDDAVEAACDCVGDDIQPLHSRLVTEAEARGLASTSNAFPGHKDGVWVLDLRTSLAPRTQALRLFLDASTGEELAREEVEAASVPEPTPTPFSRPIQIPPPEATGLRPKRWIEINLSLQSLTAWEGKTPVRTIRMSSGTAEHPTVTGQFRIYYKVRDMTMSGPGYSLPNVPNVLFFHEGYAIHGAYWHVSFGIPISHGCVNLSLSDAQWVFEWAGPELAENEWSTMASPCNPGTIVVVH